MLRIKVTHTDKSESEINNALTVILDSELGVPADSLQLIVPYGKKLIDTADTISAYDGDRLIFIGQIDSVINIRQNGAAVTKLTARSPAAALLDNEAEPLTYIRPAAELIANRHLKPMGIDEYECDNTPIDGILIIDKGMSHWQVFQRFCKRRYGTEPRISGTGKAFFKGAKSDKVIRFSDRGEGVRYISMKEYKLRNKLISDVRLKLKENAGYSSVLKNSNPECEHISRTRYVNLSADNGSIVTAKNIISDSNIAAYAVVLECPVCLTDIIGQKAVIEDSVTGVLSQMKVGKLRYTLGINGEKTTVRLIKEDK